VRTAIDTSALLALLYPDDAHNERASRLLGEAVADGSVVVTGTVETELAADPTFETRADLDAFLSDTGIQTVTPASETRFLAGEQFCTYIDRRGSELQCPACGYETTHDCLECDREIRSRQRLAADFTIGAHAEREADRLLTFDAGVYETYFDVEIQTVGE
jgi:predicted nucleic acid-binding protein